MSTTFPNLFSASPRTLLSLLFLLFSTVILRAQRTDVPSPEEELRRFDRTLEESHERASEEEEDVSGRHEWFRFQRRYPYPEIPAGVRTQAIRQTRLLKERMRQSGEKAHGAALQNAAESRWTNIGPFNVGGRVRAIAMHPTQAGTFFIGAASGGVWKTNGNFNIWTTTFDQQSALAIGSMAFDPNNPDILYVGTGEVINSHTSQFNATPAYLGDGLFKSTDGGETWFHSGLTQLGVVSDIYVRRDSSNIVYVTGAQAGGGFYRSMNGGETWEGLRSGVYFEMAVNPENEREILLAAAGTIYRSTDAGSSWTETSGFTPANAIRTSMALAPSQPDRVYALVALLNTSDFSNTAEIYRSDDGGLNWARVQTFGTSFFNSQGHYNNCIAVHPANPDVVLAGGIDVYRTSNGGNTWVNTTNSYRGGTTHPDQHVFAFDPFVSNTVYLGNDGGVYRSTNGGTAWTEIGLALPITQFYEMGLDQTRYFRAYGGTQDNGSWGAVGNGAWPDTWVSVSPFGGDGFHTIVDESDPDYIYAESQYGRLYRLRASSPGSADYLTPELDFEGSPNYDPGSWSTPIAMSAADRTSLYTGRRSLWRSLDFGNSWDRLTPGNSAMISTIALSPFDAEKITIGTSGGEVYSTTDGGVQWRRASGIGNRYVSEAVYDPVDRNRVYAVISGTGMGHVYRSDDNGASFTNITGSLPDVPTSALAVDPQNNNIIYVGNDVGVFVTLNGGDLWLPFNDGLPYAPVVDMEIHKTRRMLVAATHGRSMFEVSIDNPQPQPTLLEPNGGSPYQSYDTLDIVWAGFNSKPVRVLISYDGGKTFDTIAVNITDGSFSYVIPFLRSSSTIVRVETVEGDLIVDSDPFSVSPKPNTSSQGMRGILAGAIEVKGRDLWVADRESSDISVMRLPTLIPTGQKVTRTNIPGEVLDMAYDDEKGRFFLLTGNLANFSDANLSVMDTTGAWIAELPLPEDAVSGVTMTPEGLAVITPGNEGRVYLLNPDDGQVLSVTQNLQNATGLRRNGLVWDGATLGQGVDDAQEGEAIPDALQRLYLNEQLSVQSEVPVVINNDETFNFFGLAFYPGNGGAIGPRFYITGTDGRFYILDSPVPTSVRSSGLTAATRSTVAITEISPNPFRGRTELLIALSQSGDVRVEVFDANGRRVATPFAGRLEAGEHRVTFDAAAVASGIYYAVVSGPNGDRDIRPAVLLR